MKQDAPSSSRVDGICGYFERPLIRSTELAAAILVVLEVAILFVGVIARYVFRRPLIWSYETASCLFLWLAMLGTVIALARGEHMRFSGIVSRLRDDTREWFHAVAVVIEIVFFILLLPPALTYVVELRHTTIPGLGIHENVRGAAIVTGAILMLALSAGRIVRLRDTGRIIGSVCLVGLAGVALWAGTPLFLAIGNFNLLIFFVGLIGIIIATGVPIGFAFGVATIGYLMLMTSVPLSVVVNRLDQGMSQPVLLAVPMFVFLGLLIELTGLARSMIDFLAALLGTVRGGLNYVLVGAMLLVSGISGSKAADMAAIAPALLPEMRRHGVQSGQAVALLGASAAMADTIPPSLALIALGSVTGVSISALFAAGLVPALILAAGLLTLVAWRASREEPFLKHHDFRRIYRTLLKALPAFALPVFIRFAVADGIATATEVSTIGIVYAAIVSLLLYRPIAWRRLYPALVETAALSGAILFIIGAATSMSWALTQSGFSASLVAFMTSIPGGAAGFMAITVVVFILLGNILEGLPAILLFTPMLLPVARTLGIPEVHYGVVVIVAMSIGLFSPPFGVGFYSACAIGRVDPDEAIGPIWKYLGVLVVALIVVAAMPWL